MLHALGAIMAASSILSKSSWGMVTFSLIFEYFVFHESLLNNSQYALLSYDFATLIILP